MTSCIGGRCKRIARILIVNASILILGLVLLEGIWGNWLTSNRMNRINILRNRTIVVSDASKLYKTEDAEIVYIRDEYGLRGRYLTPYDIDILTIGGSTTDQRYISEGKTWQDILAREFLANGKDVTVVNAGVDGQSTVGNIKDFDWWFPFIPNFRAKYVLLYVGINDFYLKDESEYDNPHLKPSVLRSLKTTMQENSALYYLYRTIRGIYISNIIADIAHHRVDFSKLEYVTMEPKLQNHEEVMRERLNAYRNRLKVLGQKIGELNATPICMTQPSRIYKVIDGKITGLSKYSFVYDGIEINAADYFYMLRNINETTLAVCREMKGICINLADEIKWDDEDFYDYHHNTPRGTEKIGKYLYRNLRDLAF